MNDIYKNAVELMLSGSYIASIELWRIFLHNCDYTIEERVHAVCNLSICYNMLEDYESASKCLIKIDKDLHKYFNFPDKGGPKLDISDSFLAWYSYSLAYNLFYMPDLLCPDSYKNALTASESFATVDPNLRLAIEDLKVKISKENNLLDQVSFLEKCFNVSN